MQPDIDEALRYLGAHTSPDDELRSQMNRLADELSSQIIPRYTWRILPLTRFDQGLQAGNIPLPGRSARLMLADCSECALLICTLGTPFDDWLRRLQLRDMSRAVMLDALGSAYVEAACDEATREIAARFPKRCLTDRFSPGYGDLPLEVQPRLLEAAEARRIGVTVNPSLLMTPLKSVTALIGLADRPQIARIRGCAYCAMNQTCTLRKAGKSCDV